MDKYWPVIVERLTFLFQAIGYGLGHADWVEAKANDHPDLAAQYRAKLEDLARYPSGAAPDIAKPETREDVGSGICSPKHRAAFDESFLNCGVSAGSLA